VPEVRVVDETASSQSKMLAFPAADARCRYSASSNPIVGIVTSARAGPRCRGGTSFTRSPDPPVGIVRPRALAVLRLMTSSNLVGSEELMAGANNPAGAKAIRQRTQGLGATISLSITSAPVLLGQCYPRVGDSSDTFKRQC